MTVLASPAAAGRVLACDLATCGGFAWMELGQLLACAVLKGPRKKGNGPFTLRFFEVKGRRTPQNVMFETDMLAYARLAQCWIGLPDFSDDVELRAAGRKPTIVAMERGHGQGQGAERSNYQLGWRAGYLTSATHTFNPAARVVEVNNATWTSKAGHHFGDLFPREREARKRHSVKLAARLGVDIPISLNDAADAALLGLAVHQL